jgi:hypothetical protein
MTPHMHLPLEAGVRVRAMRPDTGIDAQEFQ